MNPYLASVITVLAAYLIGAIPFGYLIARWTHGIDIRTVGSGNIGATNVGRVLGFRFFVLVFTLDLLKGFLPTYAACTLGATAPGQGPRALAVLVALASILGHNFPVYLRFRGGKGVATSLGALLALDTPAALAAAAGFGGSLLVTRMVSVSSLFGGVVFAAVHFVRARAPWSRDEMAMTLVTCALLILLFVRHRKNLARVWEGTEPKVAFRRRKKPPEGRIAWLLMGAAAVAGLAGLLAAQAAKRTELRLGPCTLREVARVATGHQRAERLTFVDQDRLLAVTCPRYNRIVLYRVTAGPGLEPHRDIALDGHPVAIWPAPDRLYVLERPAGDARHVEPGYWETFDFQGRRIGSRYRVGFYPDDLALTPDGRYALVLTSGNAEGDANRPMPALAVIALGTDSTAHRLTGRIELDNHGANPERFVLSASGRRAVVGFLQQSQAVTVDLSDPEQPVIAERSVRALETETETLRLKLPVLGECLACARPLESGLDLYEAASMRPLGRLCIRGALNLSPTRPTGLAQAADRGLLAVATRSGSVHLIAVRPCPGQRGVAGTASEPDIRRR